MYSCLKKILFQLEPETAHALVLKSLKRLNQFGLTRFFFQQISKPCKIMGLNFPNPIGLAAGLDKSGDYIDALASLGFGFIEIGTITPKPQKGNPKPRLFRLKQQEALINRMGFNNKGVDYLIERLKKTTFNGIIGVNIGKNKDTSIETAVEDYVFLFRRVAAFASYVTINISSPNTEKLRALQHGELLQSLLYHLKKEQAQQSKYIPLVVKISPDLTQEELADMTKIFLSEKIDGIIATNTTVNKESVELSPFANEAGGLSGKPLQTRAIDTLRQLHLLLGNQIPIIGCGGIFTREDLEIRRAAGASLFQIYTGLIYLGPGVINKLV